MPGGAVTVLWACQLLEQAFGMHAPAQQHSVCYLTTTCLFWRPAAVAVLTVDRGGRRPLLLLGVGGMVLSALTIGVAVLASYSSMAVTYISIVGLFIFVGSYQACPLAFASPGHLVGLVSLQACPEQHERIVLLHVANLLDVC